MTQETILNDNDVWFVYDGKCPICASTSRAYKIKKTLGDLKFLDARKNQNHPILQEINNLYQI